MLYLLDISLGLSKDCTKCQGGNVYLVVLSEFYESVGYLHFPVFSHHYKGTILKLPLFGGLLDINVVVTSNFTK